MLLNFSVHGKVKKRSLSHSKISLYYVDARRLPYILLHSF